MLSLIRYFHYKLSRNDCVYIKYTKYSWDPISNTEVLPDTLRSLALQNVVNTKKHKPLKFNYTSISEKQWKPIVNFDNQWKTADCGGGGDCFFHCVGYALNTDNKSVRKWVSESINRNNVDKILLYYKTVYKYGSWDRDKIIELDNIDDRVSAMRNVVTTVGGTYMGDDTTMRLLVNHPTLRIGFIVIDIYGNIHPQIFLSRYTTHLILLMYLPGHWKLVGQEVYNVQHHGIQTTFYPFGLPEYLNNKVFQLAGVDLIKDFGMWEPRLELERKIDDESLVGDDNCSSLSIQFSDTDHSDSFSSSLSS